MNASAKPPPYEWARELADALLRAAEECRDRPELRAELDADPRAFLAERGAELPTGAELRLAANTPEVFHLVMPANPNEALTDTQLASIAGGSPQVASRACAVGSLAGSLSCASTFRRG